MLLTSILIIGIFHNCCCCDFYNDALKIAAIRQARNEDLYRKFNISTDDYMYNFEVEIFGPSPANRKADVLLEYQRLVKKYGRCRQKTYKQCLRECANEIPKYEKCDQLRGCNPDDKYSQIGGFCNNLKYPYFGKAHTPYNRLLDAVYQDGINEIRKASNNAELPNARVLSNSLDSAVEFMNCTTKCDHHTNNLAGLMFSQLLTHDTTSRKVVAMKGNFSDSISCCKKSYLGPLAKNDTNPSCIPIKLPRNDPFYANLSIYCQSFIRMQPTLNNECKVKYELENIVSSILDLNIIYGNSIEETNQLRTNHSGLFKMDQLNILPLDDENNFTSGDFRFGQTSLLALVHSLFYRLHNVNAENLKLINPKWSDNQLFFESRRITIAMYQHIIYYEWLPLVLDKELCEDRQLICKGKSGNCHKYDDKVNPGSLNEYANNAFRWFHSNIPTSVHFANEAGDITDRIRLSDTYFGMDLLKKRYNDLVRGFMHQKQRMRRAGYTGEIRNLFVKGKHNGQDAGVDTCILDVMRGRDGGTAPYIRYYQICLSTKIRTWSDLEPYFESAHFDLLRKSYRNVEDVDLMVGILLERRRGNLMGKIGGCLVADQFHRFKFGDRFFYSHTNNPYRFTSDQLREITKMTFSRFVCMTTDVKRVPRRGFVAISAENQYVNCKDFEPFNFATFAHRNKRSC